jgi:hypothetical protein
VCALSEQPRKAMLHLLLFGSLLFATVGGGESALGSPGGNSRHKPNAQTRFLNRQYGFSALIPDGMNQEEMDWNPQDARSFVLRETETTTCVLRGMRRSVERIGRIAVYGSYNVLGHVDMEEIARWVADPGCMLWSWRVFRPRSFEHVVVEQNCMCQGADVYVTTHLLRRRDRCGDRVVTIRSVSDAGGARYLAERAGQIADSVAFVCSSTAQVEGK